MEDITADSWGSVCQRSGANMSGFWLGDVYIRVQTFHKCLCVCIPAGDCRNVRHHNLAIWVSTYLMNHPTRNKDKKLHSCYLIWFLRTWKKFFKVCVPIVTKQVCQKSFFMRHLKQKAVHCLLELTLQSDYNFISTKPQETSAHAPCKCVCKYCKWVLSLAIRKNSCSRCLEMTSTLDY